MDTSGEWIDVSATISRDMVHWPDDPPTRLTKSEQIGVSGSEANVTELSCSAHLGTHIDAPLHFIEGGKDVASIDINKLIGRATVIALDSNVITLDDIKDHPIKSGDAILFHTSNSGHNWEHMPFMKDYAYLELDAAQHLAEAGVRCVGIDYLSIGGGDTNADVHRTLLGKEIVIIEGLKLGDVSPGEYDMVCLPLKMKGSDGGPARVVLRRAD